MPEKNENSYIGFIDNVRVWVNKMYGGSYRKKALDTITETINTQKTELILMDHILGGAHHCFTGIDLAYSINIERQTADKEILPILFLSKTEHSDKNREIGNTDLKLKGIEGYEKEFGGSFYAWIHKGYFGDEILKQEYFNSRVIPEIENLLGVTEEEKFWNMLKVVINLSYPENQKVKQDCLSRKMDENNYGGLSKDFKENIRKVYTSKKLTDLKNWCS